MTQKYSVCMAQRKWKKRSEMQNTARWL